jgi:hypothetical protein
MVFFSEKYYSYLLSHFTNWFGTTKIDSPSVCKFWAEHKNQDILLNAFKEHDKHKTGELHLTIGNEFINLQAKNKRVGPREISNL